MTPRVDRPHGPAPMDTYHAFLKCHGRKATHRIEDDRASTALPSHDCFTHDGSALFLCDSCFAFWRECMDAGDHTTWRFSVYLRSLPEPATIHADHR